MQCGKRIFIATLYYLNPILTTTIDIDVGGTFTDAYVNRNGEVAWGKVLTTYGDLSNGIIGSIEDAVTKYGTSVENLLKETEIVRYSTTHLINSLIQRKGRKLGLITTQQLQHLVFIGRSRQWADGLPRTEKRKTGKAQSPRPLIDPEMVVPIRERADSLGNLLLVPRREEIIQAANYLRQRGVQAIVVSFLWSFMNPENEQLVKQTLGESIQEVREGVIPLYLSSEVQPKWMEYPRTMAALIEAYLHREFEEQTTKLENRLRSLGYRNPLLLVHGTGGMAAPDKTRSIETYNAGPVAGTLGCLYLAKNYYGLSNVITTEMGGTSFNMSIISGGEVASYESEPVIDRWPVNVTFIENRSIGAGGGSIAWFNEALGGRLEVGPYSAGSTPGPVCYDRGGTEPTVTDADLILGYLDEKYFLGGKMKLNREKAEAAIKNRVADRLGVSVEEAALAIRKIIDDNMSGEIYTDISLKGLDPREFSGFTWGGAGPAHCIGINNRLNVKQIFTPYFSGVFNAFSASTMDVKHTYERSVAITAYNPDSPLDEFYSTYAGKFNGAVQEMTQLAIKDLAYGETKPSDILISCDLDMRYETQMMVTRVVSPVKEIRSASDAKQILSNFKQEYRRLYDVEFPDSIVRLESIRLSAMVPSHLKPRLKVFDLEAEDPRSALKGKRPALWDERSSFVETRVYDQTKLRAGNVVEGPAIVEADTTTFVVCPGWRFSIDKYFNGVLRSS